MSVRYTIERGTVCARAPRAAELLLFAALTASSAGCQWVLADIDATSDVSEPAEAKDAAVDAESAPGDLDDAESRPDDLDDASAPEPGPDAGPSRGGQGGPPASIDAAQASPPDAAREGGGTDSASPGGRDAGAPDPAVERDSSPPAPDASTACAQPVWWYEDDDKDGYGRSSARVHICPAPAGSWALQDGDCNDDDGLVHPDQLEYFGEPYRASDGSESFDYDCSGAEEGNAEQAAAPAACGALGLTACSGFGYLPVARAGATNALCGSHEKMTCQPTVLGLLVCEGIMDTVVEPYWCR